jgi:large subunit ribosomal protein L4
MKAKVLTLDSGDAGEIELKDEIFGLEPRTDLIQRVIVWQLAKRRAGSHKTLTRGEVNRTTNKVYRQKGTGQARHGARSAPQYVGGGKAMGPVLHSHEFDLPKKVRAAGLRHALSAKARDSKIVVLDVASVGEVKTKALALRLGKLGPGHMLIVDGAFEGSFVLSARNIAKVSLLRAEGLNVYDVLRRDTLVLTKAAVQAIEERLSKGASAKGASAKGASA